MHGAEQGLGTIAGGEGNCRTPSPQQQGQVPAGDTIGGGGGVVAPDPRACMFVVCVGMYM